MKTQLKLNIIFVFTLIIQQSHVHSQSYCDSNPVDIHGKLSVSGNKIVDQNNAPVSFAGNSLFWSNTFFGAEKFYNPNVISYLKNNWNTTIVRAAMGVEDFGGYLTDSSNKDRVINVVNAAIAEGLYVIIDWHSHHAEDHRQEAIDFFKEMATLYKDYPNVIYEIYNEPIHSSWANDVKPYSEAVISEIRAIDADNLIIVGSPTWSQDVDVASNDPISTALSSNVAYTLHFYAGTHRARLRAKAQTALNNGIALMVTEWGTVNADGDGNVDHNSTDEWMTFLAQNDISHLNWSVHDKSEGASILKPGASANANWSNNDFTESGLKVRSIIESWSQYCDGDPIDDTPVGDTSVEIEYVIIPSLIQAENYETESGIRTENTTDTNGGENVGYIDTNDFITYAIDVPTSKDYKIDFRVASRVNGTSFDIYSDESLIGSISSNATGGWQDWETVSTTVSLSEGEQIIRLLATGKGWNINWLEFSEQQDDDDDQDNDDQDNDDETTCNTIQTWSPSVIYADAGTRVVYENNIYENKWYTLNQNPVTFSVNSWDLWTFIGSCDDFTKASTLEENSIKIHQRSTNSLTVTIENINDYSSMSIIDIQGRIISNHLINQKVSNIFLETVEEGVYFIKVSGKKNYSKGFFVKK